MFHTGKYEFSFIFFSIPLSFIIVFEQNSQQYKHSCSNRSMRRKLVRKINLKIYGINFESTLYFVFFLLENYEPEIGLFLFFLGLHDLPLK